MYVEKYGSPNNGLFRAAAIFRALLTELTLSISPTCQLPHRARQAAGGAEVGSWGLLEPLGGHSGVQRWMSVWGCPRLTGGMVSSLPMCPIQLSMAPALPTTVPLFSVLWVGVVQPGLNTSFF